MYTYKDGAVIKGNRDGLVIILDGQMGQKEVLESLEKRISAADDFFRDGNATVKIMDADWKAEDIEPIRELLARFHISVDSITTGCTDTNGVSQDDDNPEEDLREKLEKEIFDLLKNEPEPDPERRIRTDRVRESGAEQAKNTSLLRRTLRSGQHVRYDGNVVVIGDVNPGAEITASGDILVFGSFRGVAHAGASGDEQAVVAALRLQPTQLRIANYISRAPDEGSKPPTRPEIAKIRAGNIEIEGFLV